MMPINRNHSSVAQRDVRIKIVGLGGAGSNALDRILLDGPPAAELVAINTDIQALTGSVAAEKVQIGRATTHGLGAGGDPEVGYAAAEEAGEEIRGAVKGAQMIFLCVGLGGGTGSGAARIVAALAREEGALVIAFATLPFTFEGRRRMTQAEEALVALRREADVVICFENDRMGDAVAPLAGIQEAFTMADQTISQSVRAIAALVQRRGLMHLGFDEIVTALRCPGEIAPRCLFGFGEADGDNRANDALARALKSPLMDKGRLLDGAHNVLVNVAGGPGMTLNEVQILMEELNRHIGDETRILFGAAVDPRLGQKMSVTILSALEATPPATVVTPLRPASRAVAASPVSIPPAPRVSEPAPVVRAGESEAEFVEPPAPRIADVDSDEAVAAPAESDPLRVAASAVKPAPNPKRAEVKQAQMQFEPVTRGRFERSEPTIVDGQDLDVPTFLRRNVKVK